LEHDAKILLDTHERRGGGPGAQAVETASPAHRAFSVLLAFRPRVIALFAVGEAAILLYALWEEPGFTWGGYLATALRVCAALVPLMAAGFLMNDLLDRGIDRAAGRPLHVESLGIRSGGLLSGLLFLLGVAAGFAIRGSFGLLILLTATAIIFYNLFSKKIFWLKAFLASAVIVTIYPMAYLATPWAADGPRKWTLLVHAGWLFLMAAAYEIFHDAADVAADRSFGVRTIPTKLGPTGANRIAQVFLLLGCLTAFVPWVAGWCGGFYLAFALVQCAIAALSLRADAPGRYKAVLAAIGAIIAGSFWDLIV